MRFNEEQVRAAITHQAADWFVMHRSGNLDAAERVSFGTWLSVSPLHIEEYLGIAQLAQDLPAAVADSGVSLERLLERARSEDETNVLTMDSLPSQQVHSHREHRAVRGRLAKIAAALAAIGVALLWWGSYRVATPRYATQHGEQRTWQLADRSLLRLNSDTEVTVRYSRSTRLVEIERGQAYFEVTPEANRRFQVVAGAVSATAIGTKFDVYRQEAATVVTVVEGEVSVGTERGTIHVRTGEQLRATGGSGPAILGPADLQRSTAWLRRQIAFDQEPLANVVAEFNRYSALPIEIDTPALAQLRVSGVFSADDTPSFVSFLRTLTGVTVETTATRIRVREAPSSSAKPK